MKSYLKTKFLGQKFMMVVVGILGYAMIYSLGWSNPFFQDDFLLLEFAHPSQIETLADFLQPITQNFHYRPLAFNFYYWLMQILFGLNWTAFHLVNFIWLLLHGFLVCRLSKLITKSNSWSIWAGLIYLISPIHFMTQFWLASFNNAQSASLLLLSFICFIYYQRRKSQKLHLLALIIYLLSLLFNEGSVVMLGLVVWYLIVFKFTHLVSLFKSSLSWLVVTCIYLGVRLQFIGLPAGEAYALSIGPEIFATLRWYVLRILGLPEGVGFVPYKEIMLILVGLWSVIILVTLLKVRGQIKWRNIFFGGGWFLISSSIFLLLPNHLSAYYMETAFVGILIIYVEIFRHVKLKNWPVFLLLLNLIIGGLSVTAMKQTHWVGWRGEKAKLYIREIQSQCDQVSDNQINLSVPPEDIDEVGIVLNQDSGARVICNNFELQTKIELRE